MVSGLSSILTQYARLVFPPGKGVFIEYPGAYPRGRGDFSILENLWLSSAIFPELMTATSAWRSPVPYILDDTVKVGGTDNSFYARCTRPGTSGSSNPFGSGPYAVGQIIDEGVLKPEWTIVRAAMWITSANYSVGDRIQVPGENRVHFLCTRAGQAHSTTSPFTLAGQDSGHVLGATVDEGAGKPAWLVVAHTGVRMRARGNIRNVQIERFSNSGVSILPESGFESSDLTRTYGVSRI